MDFKMNHLGWMMVVALVMLTALLVLATSELTVRLKNNGDESTGEIRRHSKILKFRNKERAARA